MARRKKRKKSVRRKKRKSTRGRKKARKGRAKKGWSPAKLRAYKRAKRKLINEYNRK